MQHKHHRCKPPANATAWCKPPANATAWCKLHERLMNDKYIHRRGCAMRRYKHLNWLEKKER